MDAQAGSSNTPLPNPLASNPLATIDLRWQRALKSLHLSKEPLTGTLNDVQGVTQAWLMATRHMQLRHIDDTSPREHINRQILLNVYSSLKFAKLMHALLYWFIGCMYDNKDMIVDNVKPLLDEWEHQKSEAKAQAILTRLLKWKNEWYRETGAFTHHGVDSYWPFKRAFRTILLNYLPPSFQDCLRVMVHSTLHNFKDDGTRVKLAEDLDSMGILSDFKTHISGALEEEITQRILTTCPRVRNRPMLPELRAWYNDNIKTWLTDMYGKDRPDATWRKFEQFMMKVLCDLRISELFEIIVDYEDKTHPLPVLQDLKECLIRTGQRRELVNGLREQTIKRLLQPGAATSDILQQYVSTIKVLRFLDPPGVLLYGVAEPIRRYLRERPDTIKIIVMNLIPRRKRKLLEGDEEMENDDEEEDKDGFLLDDQNEPTPIQANEEVYEDYSDPNWMPAANDAEPTFRVQKPADIISTLVSIFGSKDLFIKELQVAFGQRLLAITDGNYDDELHNLEVLKIRFGDVALQVCDVMMKDLADSRRIDQHVHDDLNSAMHTTILSRLFWPPIPKSTLTLPGQFKAMQERYEVEYERQKPDKKLRYLPHMGTVDLTVEMDSGEQVSATVNTLQAAIIELFSEQRKWDTEELAQRLGNLDVTSVSLALMYWHMAGVIEPTDRNVFELRESLGDTNQAGPMADDYEIELGLEEGDSEDREANAEMFWNFVRAMLKNLHPMTTDEIHSRFRTMAPIEQSFDESRELLESWLRQGLLDYMSGLWSLP